MLSWNSLCPGELRGWGGETKWGEMRRKEESRVLLSVSMLPPRGWEQWGSIPAAPYLLGVYLFILWLYSTVNSHSAYDLSYPQVFFFPKKTLFRHLFLIFSLDSCWIYILMWNLTLFLIELWFEKNRTFVQVLRILILIISCSKLLTSPNHMLLGNRITCSLSTLSILLMRPLNNSEIRNKWTFI